MSVANKEPRRHSILRIKRYTRMRKPKPTYIPRSAASMSFAISKVTISEAAMKTTEPTNATNEPTMPAAISRRFRFFCTQPGCCAGLTFMSTLVTNDARPRMTTSAEIPTNGPADSWPVSSVASATMNAGNPRLCSQK